MNLRACPRSIAVLLCSLCGLAPTGRAESQGLGTARAASRDLKIDGATSGFSLITGMTVSLAGNIAITQPDDGQVRFFRPDGSLLGTFGRPGEGPGEFRWPVRLGVSVDTVWVIDGTLPRITMVSPDLKLLRTVPQPLHPKAPPDGGASPAGGRIGVVALYANGDALLQVFVGRDAQPPRWQKVLEPRTSAFFRVEPDGTIRALVASVPVPGKFCDQDGPRGPVSVPACSSPSWDASSDGSRFVIVSPSITGPDRATLLVTAFGPMGDTLFSRRVPFTPHLIDAAASDSIHEAEAAKFRTPEGAAAARQIALPPMFPPVVYVVVGRDGVTWIGLNSPGAVRQWICLDAKGVPIAFTNLPRAVRVRFADQSTLWGTEEDDDGEESVVRYRLH